MTIIDKDFGIRWASSQSVDTDSTIRWDDLDPVDIAPIIRWGIKTVLSYEPIIRWSDKSSNDRALIERWAVGDPLDIADIFRWADADALDTADILKWDDATPLDTSNIIRWDVCSPLDKARIIRWGVLTPSDRANILKWSYGIPLDVANILRWGHGTPMDIEIVIMTPNYVPGQVNIGIPWDTYAPRDKPLAIRWNRKVIYMINTTFALTRTSDSRPIHIIGGTMSADINSWAWTLDLELPSRNEMLAIQPDALGEGTGMVEVDLALNGYDWKFFVTGVDDMYGGYGSSGYSAKGMSLSREIGPPDGMKYTKTWGATSTQALMSNELTDTGWTIDFDTAAGWDVISEVTIPADVYGVDNKTKMEIICQTARNIGGIIQTHPNLPKLLCYSRLSVTPRLWEPVDMDRILPNQPMLSHAPQHLGMPKYNYIAVSADHSYGTMLRVCRSGVDPDPGIGELRIAPEMVNPLVLNANIAEQIGRIQLDTSGYDIRKHTIGLPMLPSDSLNEPKLLLPPQTIAVTDLHSTWCGQVTAVKVSFDARRGTGQVVTVYQYLT